MIDSTWVSDKAKVQSPKFAFSNLRFENAHKFSGGCVERATPVPIPNTEVKPLGADGTARATAWESRKPPGLFKKARERNLAGFFVVRSRLIHARRREANAVAAKCYEKTTGELRS